MPEVETISVGGALVLMIILILVAFCPSRPFPIVLLCFGFDKLIDKTI
jgi:hypothetical protein